MALRFQRSLKIASGERISFSNHSENSAGISVKDSSHEKSGTESMGVQLALDDLGGIKITDKTGDELTPQRVQALYIQFDSHLKNWLEEQAEQINQALDRRLTIHYDAPDPDAEITFRGQTSEPPILNLPNLKLLGLRGRLFKSRRKKIEQENRALILQHNQGFQEKDKAWLDNNKEQEGLRQLIEVRRLQDTDGMSDFLELRLKNLKWPREVNVNFDIVSLSDLWIDMACPVIEDMPARHAVVAKRGYKLNIKNVSATQTRRNYAYYIHSMGFRIIGECFHALPTLKRVTFSSYLPSKNKVPEEPAQYLYSVVVDRDQWRKIKFNNLKDIDVFEVFNLFELRRSVTKTLVFKPIEPFEPGINHTSTDQVLRTRSVNLIK